ncbi:DegT/DnrJ/EryC1/StrS aminotransferase [candidate division BRC1 bacterium HGW-BRC1-1]|jgi:dTDP-4-amino-4,6-dideoxygalactose transaminase|nr:MAG: DegT/DnrJ/EryC1/StrS aminotransferase [candidate division BRC1 bacterium HGW-BRC1-1]
MWRIPLSDLNYGPEEERAVTDVLRSRWLTMGPRTEEFEARFAEYTGARHAVAVANCTCGLELVYAWAMCRAVEERGVCPHDPPVFLVPDITFTATANAALVSGGRAVLVDIENADRPFLSMESCVRELRRQRGKVAAISLMHYGGTDAGAEAFRDLARREGVLLIEDAAHAAGGFSQSGRHLGTIGEAGVFSFFSNKNLATGEGGMVVTDDADLASALRRARSHGMTALTYERHAAKRHGYDVMSAGHNYRCTEITAALGIAQLAKLDAGNARRRELLRLYRDTLAGTSRVVMAMASDEELNRSAGHIAPLICESEKLRDAIRAACDAQGIQTSHHYTPLHEFTSFAQIREACDEPPVHLPHAEKFARREITMPLWPGMTDEQVAEICTVVLKTAGCEA